MNWDIAFRIGAVVSLLMGGWALSRTRPGIPPRPVNDGVRLWFSVSVGAAITSAAALIVLFVVGIWLEWLIERYSGVLAPLGVIVAAAIASAGGARLAMAQTANANRARVVVEP